MSSFVRTPPDENNFVISFTQNPKDDFGAFAKGYSLAANRLAELLLAAPRFSDYEAYPVVFLYRHAFELSLKHTIYSSARLAALQFCDGTDAGLQNSHDLQLLSRVTCMLLGRLFPTDASLRLISERIATISTDWSGIDPRSDGYRYLINTRGNVLTIFYQVFNLAVFYEQMSSLLEEMDTIHFGLGIETGAAEEAYRALQSLISI